jgi:phospholipase/carboxylesterase
MENQRDLFTVNGWTFRVQEPQIPGTHRVILLLHGWTGDEDAMWVFASRLPQDALLVAPRGIFPTSLGGYSWHPHEIGKWPWVDDFRPVIEELLEILCSNPFPNSDCSSVSMVGFSQGAALAFSFGLMFPARVQMIAGLSGFMPEGADAIARNKPLLNKKIFLAHGSQDQIVTVDRARSAVKILESAGAQVSYCEDDVGHKLSASCYQGLQKFFAKYEEGPR